MPHIHIPQYVCMLPVHLYTPRGSDTPLHVPYTPLCICMFSEASACCGGCRGPLTCWTPPYMLDTSPVWEVPPHMSYTPHSLVGFPVPLYVLGISACVMGIFPLCWGLGVFPHMLGVWGHQHHWLSIYFILFLLVVHYVSHVYHGYDHYSSGYSGVFWAVICFIGDCGSFHDGASCNIGSVWSGSATIPNAKRLWRCYWPCLCVQQQPPSSMPLLAYANYAMGSPQVGFFFRVEPPTIWYIICLVSILASAFYFQVPSWMLYSPICRVVCCPLPHLSWVHW